MSDPYVLAIPLRWSDMDAYAHVNNVQFLRLLEEARIVGFRDWFGQGPTLLDQGVVVSRQEIEYVAPLFYRREPVEVAMWVTRISASGFEVSYIVRDPASVGQTVYAIAATGVVLYDFSASSTRRLSPAERLVVEQYQGDPVPFRWGRK